MNAEERILKAISSLPGDIALRVLSDVNKRINDWLSSGGSDSDHYIEQQVRYAGDVSAMYDTKK